MQRSMGGWLQTWYRSGGIASASAATTAVHTQAGVRGRTEGYIHHLHVGSPYRPMGGFGPWHAMEKPLEPPWRRCGGAAADFLASGVLAPARLGHKASKRHEARRLKARGYEPILTGTRFCLLKRPENLTESQEVKLVELLKYNLRA